MSPDERRAAEEERELSREFLEQAEEIGRIGSWTSGLGPDPRLVWSPMAYAIFGVEPGTPISNETFFGLVHEEDREAIRQAVDAAVRERRPYTIEHRVVHPDGKTRWILERANVVRGPDGEPLRLIGVAQDITERKEFEAALLASEQRWRQLAADQRRLLEEQQEFVALIEGSSDLIAISSLTGSPRWVNSAGRLLLGLEPEEDVSRRTFQELHAPDSPARARALLDEVLSHGRWQGEVRLRHLRGGAPIEVWSNVSLVRRREDGQPLCIATVQRDLGDRRRLEEQLRQAQKMEAIGRLAGGVAHDFNNLLTAIYGYSDLLLDGLAPGDPLREHALEIRRAGVRAAALTQQLLAFSRKQVLQPRVFHLNGVVRELESMLTRLMGEDIELRIQLAADLGHVCADPGQIEQVILNLAVNARDAMPRGGLLRIETWNAEHSGQLALRVPEGGGAGSGGGGPYVVLSIADDGVGMDAEALSHLFEPFFTTKPKGKGTGLGLSTVYGIVRQSGGHITVESAPGRGARFDVHLPRVDAAPESPPPPVAAAPGRGTEVILLAEDDDTVRGLASAILSAHGYTVIAAADGVEALALLEAHPAIDLLLTDVVMPRMSGAELARRACAARPGLRTLFASGYTGDAIAERLDPGVAFIQKPFSPASLLERVREVLDGR